MKFRKKNLFNNNVFLANMYVFLAIQCNFKSTANCIIIIIFP